MLVNKNNLVLKVNGVELPYPSTIVPGVHRLRAIAPNRNAQLLNVEWTSGSRSANLDSITLTWEYMTLVEYKTVLDAVAYVDEFSCHYPDPRTNTMRDRLFYADDDLLVIGNTHFQINHENNCTELVGYRNVSVEFIQTLNDDPSIIASNDVVIVERQPI